VGGEEINILTTTSWTVGGEEINILLVGEKVELKYNEMQYIYKLNWPLGYL
jgi:hypothetical protein